MNRPDIATRIKALGWLWSDLTKAISVIAIIWAGSGWIVKGYAEDAFEDLLLKNEAFRKLQEQGVANGAGIAGVGTKVDGLEDQLGDLSGQITAQNGAVVRMEKQFDQLNSTLTQLLLQRRSSIDDIPPFPKAVAP